MNKEERVNQFAKDMEMFGDYVIEYGVERFDYDKVTTNLDILGYHKIIWHKVSDGDLPKNDSVVLAFYKPGYYATFLYLKNADNETDWWCGASKRINEDIIAWTELPEYKE